MQGINRRRFLSQAGVTAAAAILTQHSSAAADRVDLILSASPGSHPLPATYTGLSYELAQLTEPDFFSSTNSDLVAHFRLLSKQGVLRLGGNTSEFCWLQFDSATPAPKLHIPPGKLEANWMPHRLFAIPPQAIDNLAGFLDATGWRLIYGLNFGNSTPERAAAEAAFVASKLSQYLDYFQIGNEPDFYRDANNGTRPPGWDFNDYAAEWLRFAQAIQARVPQAHFGGPDVGASSDWITRFAEQISPQLNGKLIALTGHYYAEGPPNDPAVTIQRLLSADAKIPARMQQIEPVAKAHALAYRMTEGNSCYRGGKPGMSDAFASALWAGDYMLLLASLGCTGVNLHGGASRFLTAGLGGHTPGLEAAQKPQTMPSGFYTPIATEQDQPIHAMPIFYGMMLANQFAGTTLLSTDLQSKANATSYAAQTQNGYRLAIFNKDPSKSIYLKIQAPEPIRKATAWRLEAPSLDATSGVTLAGASIQPHARWSPHIVEPVQIRDDRAAIEIPAASAALIFMETGK